MAAAETIDRSASGSPEYREQASAACCRKACASCWTSPWRWSVKPEMLILDEPTSGVSADEKFGIMDMVMNAVRSEGVTVIFVEHDMEIVSRYSQRVIAFYEGRILADGAPARRAVGRR